PERYEVAVFDPAVDLPELVRQADRFDLAFPALHGPLGEDGTVQGLLELAGLPYVGSGVLASAQCMDKAATKAVYRTLGLPVVEDLVSQAGEAPQAAAARAAAALGLPLVVKPLNQGSSVGLTIAATVEAAAEALMEAWRLHPTALVERHVQGREFTVAVLGNRRPQALPPIEIVPAPGHVFFDYQAKYEPGQAQEICPASLEDVQTARISELAVAAHRGLGCRGLSRTDFILDGAGEFRLLETNTLPGLTANSLLPKAAAAAGLSFAECLDELVNLALNCSRRFE
ncbi:MAG: D-alanine--D-alanine ligase, partial [Deltaproteobacteria bacterium]|nr:D-alanine--D-alanine ligase [Deltaproteobacteria bacterium]